MIYLDFFTFPDSDMEFDFFLSQKRTCYDTYYPFQVLSKHQFRRIDFEPVTILYGGNGSGTGTKQRLGECGYFDAGGGEPEAL